MYIFYIVDGAAAAVLGKLPRNVVRRRRCDVRALFLVLIYSLSGGLFRTPHRSGRNPGATVDFPMWPSHQHTHTHTHTLASLSLSNAGGGSFSVFLLVILLLLLVGSHHNQPGTSGPQGSRKRRWWWRRWRKKVGGKVFPDESLQRSSISTKLKTLCGDCLRKPSVGRPLPSTFSSSAAAAAAVCHAPRSS